MSQPTLKKFNLQLHGMTCQSCEVLVERKFKKVPGVVKVNVDHRNGKAELVSTEMPHLQDFQNALGEEKYTVTPYGAKPISASQNTYVGKKELRRLEAVQKAERRQGHMQTGAIALLVFGVYFFLRQTGILKNGFDIGIKDSMSYGYIFLIGLAAATSTCIAVTGGLLLSVAGKYAQLYPNLTGLQKFRPHIFFNIGRVLSYTLLGGLVGLLGSAFTLSTKGTGWLSIAAALFMMLMALNMLKVPGIARLNLLRMPKFLSHKIHDASGKPGKFAPLFMGAGTFFLPCGFTQALQIYALSTGSFEKGALTMFVFSLGTLPALVSLGAISSFMKGAFSKIFMKTVGAVVLILAFLNINNGLALTGSNWTFSDLFQNTSANTIGIGSVAAAVNDPNVTIDGQTQIVRMTAQGISYLPNHFTIYQGLPVKWMVQENNVAGCARILTIPKYGVTKYLQPGAVNEIDFTPSDSGELLFSCPMGMYRGTFTVVPRPNGAQAPQAQVGAAAPQAQGGGDQPSCDPATPGCNIQVANVTIGSGGYYPREITVKKGVPAELIIDDQISLGGCMGTAVIPEYNVAKTLKIGKNKLAFNPTRTGTFPITCSMGGRMAQLTVVD